MSATLLAATSRLLEVLRRAAVFLADTLRVDFFPAGFFADTFRAARFFAAGFFAVVFFAVVFFAVVFFAVVFFAVVFFAVVFFAAGFFATARFVTRLRAVRFAGVFGAVDVDCARSTGAPPSLSIGIGVFSCVSRGARRDEPGEAAGAVGI